MLTRRKFAAFAPCALCGIGEFVATAASAQGTPPPTSGVSRKILSQTDGPMPGYTTILVEATVEQGAAVGRHTHPGVESAYWASHQMIRTVRLPCSRSTVLLQSQRT